MTAPIVANDPREADLEDAVQRVEVRLQMLGESLLRLDSLRVEASAQELQKSLADAVLAFSSAARLGPLPGALRQRLVKATGEVAAHRESLSRATVALDRAMEVLMPRARDAVYSPQGQVAAGVPLPRHAVAA